MADLNDYDDLDATTLIEMMRSREVSVTEVTRIAIDRVEQRNDRINAVVHRSFERALEVAKNLDDEPARDALLFGLPFLIKDLHAADAGQPDTWSTQLFAKRVPGHDDEVVARFKRAGVVILGRTNTPELGLLGVTEPRLRGPARNPWNQDHITGGSSGGAGAAVAAHMVPMAHASDGGGSIRIPAALCGLVGLKPTRARTPWGPERGPGWGGMVTDGVVAHSVRDAALALDVIAGPELGAPYYAPGMPEGERYVDAAKSEPRKLKIAFTTDSLYAGQTHADVAEVVAQTAQDLRDLGHEVMSGFPPIDRLALRRSYLHVVASGLAVALGDIGREAGVRPRPTDFEPRTWMMSRVGHALSGAELSAALDEMYKASRVVAKYMQNVDLLLLPTTARTASRVGELAPGKVEAALMRSLARAPIGRILVAGVDRLAEASLAATPNTQLFNQTGQPAISLPLGVGKDGLPIGVQLAARMGEEGLLIQVAAQLERSRPWAARKPAWI